MTTIAPSTAFQNPAAEPVNNVRDVVFSEQKYGHKLLIDVAWIRDMPSFIKHEQPYRLDFYDITLVTQGSGEFWLDTQRYAVAPNTVFFTSPGQVRRWVVDQLDGICLFFPSRFLLEHFNDPLFLHRLRYFHNEGSPLALRLKNPDQEYLYGRLTAMLLEVSQLQPDSAHMLRAIAYEVLINLNRWYAREFGQQLDTTGNHAISRFRQLIERNYMSVRSVNSYARELGLTPGHLNFLAKRHLGRSAGDLIRSRSITEARRLLIHTERDVGWVGSTLGFDDPSYFSRSFKRATGFSPLAYRRHARQELQAIV